jgi:hypothetical protein
MTRSGYFPPINLADGRNVTLRAPRREGCGRATGTCTEGDYPHGKSAIRSDTMSESPYGAMPGGQWPPPGAPQGYPPARPATPTKPSRAPVIISLVIAIIAIAVAVGAWFRPAPNTSDTKTTPQYSEQQVADAKEAVCAAHDLVTRATETAGAQTSDDPTVKFLFAVNGRVGAITSANYILATLEEFPATSDQLANAVRETALAYQETNLLHLANAPKEETDVVYDKLNAADARYVEACK